MELNQNIEIKVYTDYRAGRVFLCRTEYCDPDRNSEYEVYPVAGGVFNYSRIEKDDQGRIHFFWNLPYWKTYATIKDVMCKRKSLSLDGNVKYEGKEYSPCVLYFKTHLYTVWDSSYVPIGYHLMEIREGTRLNGYIIAECANCHKIGFCPTGIVDFAGNEIHICNQCEWMATNVMVPCSNGIEIQRVWGNRDNNYAVTNINGEYMCVNDENDGNYHRYTCGHCGTEVYDLISWVDTSGYPAMLSIRARRNHRLCWNCQRQNDRPIKGYYYKPDPKFKQLDSEENTDELFFGVELELDSRERNNDENAADELVANDEEEDYIYVKHDGSLNYGIEIVSHPGTYAAHCEEFNWRRIIDIANSHGMKDLSSAGLHVHIGENDCDFRNKMVLLFWKFNKFITMFTRRQAKSINNWACMPDFLETRYYGSWAESENRMICDIENYIDRGRYLAVNCSNDNTTEIRIFASTIDYKVLLGSINFCKQAAEFCLNNDYETIWNLTKVTDVWDFSEYNFCHAVNVAMEKARLSGDVDELFPPIVCTGERVLKKPTLYRWKTSEANGRYLYGYAINTEYSGDPVITIDCGVRVRTGGDLYSHDAAIYPHAETRFRVRTSKLEEVDYMPLDAVVALNKEYMFAIDRYWFDHRFDSCDAARDALDALGYNVN